MITYKVNSDISGDLNGVLTLIENTNKKILAKFIIKEGFTFEIFHLWPVTENTSFQFYSSSPIMKSNLASKPKTKFPVSSWTNQWTSKAGFQISTLNRQNIFAYFEYDLYRTLIVMKYNGRSVLISLSKQKDICVLKT